jgi:hypothetical protein
MAEETRRRSRVPGEAAGARGAAGLTWLRDVGRVLVRLSEPRAGQARKTEELAERTAAFVDTLSAAGFLKMDLLLAAGLLISSVAEAEFERQAEAGVDIIARLAAEPKGRRQQ